jgi:hypothetical protein
VSGLWRENDVPGVWDYLLISGNIPGERNNMKDSDNILPERAIRYPDWESGRLFHSSSWNRRISFSGSFGRNQSKSFIEPSGRSGRLFGSKVKQSQWI